MVTKYQVRRTGLNRVSSAMGKAPFLGWRLCLNQSPLAESLEITTINQKAPFRWLVRRYWCSFGLIKGFLRAYIFSCGLYITTFPAWLLIQQLTTTPRPPPINLLLYNSVQFLRTKMQFNIAAIATAAMALLIAQAAAQSNDQECCASMYYTHQGSLGRAFFCSRKKLPHRFTIRIKMLTKWYSLRWHMRI